MRETAFSSWVRGVRGLNAVVGLVGGVKRKEKKIFLIENLDFLHSKFSSHNERTVNYLVVLEKALNF
jgi:hypothetical protein